MEGENADTLPQEKLKIFASDCASFLKELQKANTTGAPKTSPFRRGESPRFYDEEAKKSIASLKHIIPVEKARSVWEKAKISDWQKKPVWVHGDFSPGNILVREGRLSAVIDFGSSCVGEPSCDLVIAWTLLNQEARDVFKKAIDMDQDTWDRAKGWCLWKALITLDKIENKSSEAAKEQLIIINRVLDEG